MNREQVSDHELCAYADRRLGPAEEARIAARLEQEPQLAARVADWRRQNAALHATFDAVLDEPVPARLLAAAGPLGSAQAARRAPPLRWAAAVGWLALGLIAGYGVRDFNAKSTAQAELAASLPRRAAIAHAVYVPEVRHPVEVAADQQAHLTGWLTKRLGTEVRAPNLDGQGYQLMGGRLLPGERGPGAQLMYQDATGERLTLYLSRSESDRSTAFRFAEEDGVGVFYWVDGGTGYALSGKLPREQLLAVANAVYRQLNP